MHLSILHSGYFDTTWLPKRQHVSDDKISNLTLCIFVKVCRKINDHNSFCVVCLKIYEYCSFGKKHLKMPIVVMIYIHVRHS